jgi:DHA1 family bicyclomycin/chloramphenicol resistance-like MFS transporter
VFSVSPILAPLAGSGVIALAGWRGVFWAVTVAGIAGLAMSIGFLKETRSAKERVDSSFGSAMRGYALLLRDRHYLGLVLIGSFAIGGFFIYLANSPFVLINHYGLSTTQYGLAFSLNAAAFIASSQFTGALGERFGLVPVVKVSAVGATATMVLMLGYYLAGGDALAVMVVLYFISSAFMGMVIPTTSVLALDHHGAIAGTASALLGTLQMLTGAVMMGIAGLFNDGRPLPMVIGMTAGPLIALGLTGLTLGGRRSAPSPA